MVLSSADLACLVHFLCSCSSVSLRPVFSVHVLARCPQTEILGGAQFNCVVRAIVCVMRLLFRLTTGLVLASVLTMLLVQIFLLTQVPFVELSV